MDNKITNIKERILKIPVFKGVSKEKFFEEIGMTYGNFKGKSKETPINSNAIATIIAKYPEISLEWLITGKGSITASSTNDFTNKNFEDPRTEYEVLQRIPLISGRNIDGFDASSFQLDKVDVKEYYVVPKFKNQQVDFMMEIEESSMYPNYNSGDVIACRVISESDFIQWNKTHVIATKGQGILIKRITPSKQENVLTMISDNSEYYPFDVSKEEINLLALVVGVIRLE